VGIAIMDSLPVRFEATAAVLSLWRVVFHFCRNRQPDYWSVKDPCELVLGIAVEQWRWRVDRRLDIESA
jgi:hypothetical protein